MSLSLPQLVANRYQLTDLVGEGGYGVVYRGLDRTTGHPVAVKVLSQGATQDPDRVERMLREQQAMVALAGVGVVGALDLCELPNSQVCLVMEWLDGQDFEQYLTALERAGQHIDTTRLLEIVNAVGYTLGQAHQIGIVHRDIKPANIFLTTYSGSARVLDFGLSRMKWSRTLTAVGVVMGSPSYIAPETWRGESKQIDHRADLYALGAVVFRALSGQMPFGNNSLAEQMIATTSAPRPSLYKWRPDLPPGVDAWVAKALAIDPARRFQNAAALCEALGTALGKSSSRKVLPVGSIALPETLGELQNVIAGAFGRAASLLKRLTGASATAVPTPTSAPSQSPAESSGTAEEKSSTDRKSQVAEWLSAAQLNLSQDALANSDTINWADASPKPSQQQVAEEIQPPAKSVSNAEPAARPKAEEPRLRKKSKRNADQASRPKKSKKPTNSER